MKKMMISSKATPVSKENYDKTNRIEHIAALLQGETTLALATADEQGEASIAPLFYVVDDDLTIFWLSSNTSAHSRHLTRVSRAAATVYRRAAGWKDISGVQMRGSVSIVMDQRYRREMVRKYCQRFHLGTMFRLAISRCALFSFRPEFLRYIDNSMRFGTKVEFTRNAGQEWTRIGA